MKPGEAGSTAEPGLKAFAAAFSQAMTDRRMTLVEMKMRLERSGNPVSIAGLSYWRRGERRPEGARSLAAVAEIEVILGLQNQSLSALLPPATRTGSVPSRAFTVGVEDWAESIDTLAADLLSDPIDSGREITTYITAHVNEDGKVARQTIRSRIQAVSTPITEFVWAEIPPSPSPVTPIFTAGAGCRLARTQSKPDGDGFAALFSLDHAVPVGTTALVEFEMEFPPGYPTVSRCEHLTSRRTHEIVLWVQYQRHALPDWVDELEVVDGVETRRVRKLEGTSIHVERTDFPAGLLSLRWGSVADRSANLR